MNTHVTTLHIYITLFVSLIFPQETSVTNFHLEIDSLSALDMEADRHSEEIRDTMVVDLSGEEYFLIDGGVGTHIMAKPWYRNMTVTGFGGMGYLKTGAAGTRRHGGFLINEVSLFWEQDIWNDITFFIEFQINRLGMDSTLFIRTGEVYIYFRSLSEPQSTSSLGLKIGRFDIPFGEEYLWQDAKDNPLISNSAYYTYGWDEGVLFFGTISQINWIFSVMDGTYIRSVEDHPSKAWAGKIYTDLWTRFYLSISLMTNGWANKSAIEFGESHIEPVGLHYFSTNGKSPNDKVKSNLLEIDVKYRLGNLEKWGHVSATFGSAQLIDQNPEFSRDWTWFSIEPLIKINNNIYGIFRLSEIGTYNNRKGYHFDGKTTAGGNEAFGYDTRRFRRVSMGAGWKPNPRLLLKVELGQDWFYLINNSPFKTNNNQRGLIGFEMVASF
ncbi:MAG: hypothetical protein IIB95_06385 [Candidatus Marinimicrobia bacterium]|nr:hypothetical protein [Candidatus Neomarinimicrobiota bacterium]